MGAIISDKVSFVSIDPHQRTVVQIGSNEGIEHILFG